MADVCRFREQQDLQRHELARLRWAADASQKMEAERGSSFFLLD